eukprot:14483272-Heterocapsa_arctica.AAC.1
MGGGRQVLVKRSSSACHVPGKVVGWELQADRWFQAELTAEQAPQKVARLELQERIPFGSLNTQSDKHPTRSLACNERRGKQSRSRGRTRREI